MLENIIFVEAKCENCKNRATLHINTKKEGNMTVNEIVEKLKNVLCVDCLHSKLWFPEKFKERKNKYKKM